MLFYLYHKKFSSHSTLQLLLGYNDVEDKSFILFFE